MTPAGDTPLGRPSALPVLTFLFLGPPIGTATVLVAQMAASVIEAPSLQMTGLALAAAVFILPLALLYGYAIGALPALLTGVAAAVLQRTSLRGQAYVSAVALIGWAVVALPLVFAIGWTALLVGLVGGVPALCCAVVTQPSEPGLPAEPAHR